jgi:hypothetical protein
VVNLISENTIEHRMLDTLSHKRALSEGVLDLKGDLKDIKLRSGKQAFMSKLEQLMSTAAVQPKAPANSLPADRAFGFAQEARQRINGALCRCEERYPQDGPHSVLYVVVERDAPQFRLQLDSLHQDYFGSSPSDPPASVRLEVIDRATDEALQRLIAAGLVANTTRATRPLWPPHPAAPAPSPLSGAEREKASAYRAQAARKLKMAAVLAGGDLADEARTALLAAVEPLGCALAVENRLPEPHSLEDALLPPLGLAWNNALPLLRSFLRDTSHAIPPVVSALGQI